MSFSSVESDNPSRISVKIIEQVKKSGEFDKYRKELVDSIVNSVVFFKLYLNFIELFRMICNGFSIDAKK